MVYFEGGEKILTEKENSPETPTSKEASQKEERDKRVTYGDDGSLDFYREFADWLEKNEKPVT